MRTFMKIVIASVATLTLSSAANAADVYDGKMAAPQGTTLSYDDDTPWDYRYVGVHGGWVDSGIRHTATGEEDTVPFSTTADFSSDNWLLGVQLGTQKQYGNVVLGAEVDASWMNSKAHQSADVNYDESTDAAEHEAKVNWLTTARLHLGYPVKNFMPYVTGGLAVADVDSGISVAGEDGGNFATPDDIRFGWTAGGGIKVNVTDRITLDAKYLYVDLGDNAISAAFNGTEVEFNGETELNILRAELGFKF